MRGEIQNIHGVQQAVALLDLALAGIKAEMADDVFDWLAMPVPPSKAAAPVVAAPAAAVVPLQPAVVVARPASARPQLDDDAPVFVPPTTFEPLTSSSAPSAALTRAQAKRVIIPKVEIAGEVWSQGDAGGVVLVVQGGAPVEGAAKLAMAMLAAVGLQNEPLAWVGYTHTVKASELLERIQGFSPTQVLVLGQAPLGLLLGRNLGVEGWHAAGGHEIAGWSGAPVGVTYPLELLMKQPLFKRLAWQHLLAWGNEKQQVATEGNM